MRALPTGTVTFLFTDVEGSTRLLRELGDAYPDALAEHRRQLREAFQRHGGVEVDTQGDAFFVAFARASDACAAAEEGRRSLEAGELRVRMGLHTGEPVVTDEGYVGIDVHRAARIAAAGHGGQILVSQATRDLLATDGLRDLGEHRLKDLSAPERLYQVGDGDFPPLKTLYGTNLPVPLTLFLGRERELEEVRSLLLRDDVRLVSLTGAGGSGKTRLALQAAGALADAYPHGVWWVPLASVGEADDVLPAAARVFGGAELTDAIGDRRLLLLLDNFEHVMDAAPGVAALLGACPGLGVLITSRERLRVHGEQVYPVPVLARAEARALFVSRARATSPEFEADDHVDQLCARLDDLPLAIELAAARVALLSTEQLLERLGSRLDLLRGDRGAETRQRTLRATIEWSHDLLNAEEQGLLAALSVFRGGWTVEAAEGVSGADLELLQSLADKSLVRRWKVGHRFGMLETIREFAAEKLEPARRDSLVRRLLEYLLELFDGANLTPEDPGTPRMGLAQEERPNVDVALIWAAQTGEVSLGLELLRRLEMYWVTNDPIGGRERLDALLARARGDIDPLSYGRALRFRGATYDMTSRNDLAEPEYERAIEAIRSLGDDDEITHLTLRIANSAVRQGDVERGVRLATEALERSRARGTRRDEAVALTTLSTAAFMGGDGKEGIRLAHESASVADSLGFTWWRGVTLLSAAEWLVAAKEPDEAEGDFLLGLELLASVRDRVNLPIALATGAALAAERDDAVRAGTLWGALEAAAEREPKPTTRQAMHDYAPYLERVAGAEFDHGRTRGHTLLLDEAVEYALTLPVRARPESG